MVDEVCWRTRSRTAGSQITTFGRSTAAVTRCAQGLATWRTYFGRSFMCRQLVKIVAGCAFGLMCAAGVASAQAPAAASASVVVENPTYTSVPLEIVVNKPIAEVWKRI